MIYLSRKLHFVSLMMSHTPNTNALTQPSPNPHARLTSRLCLEFAKYVSQIWAKQNLDIKNKITTVNNNMDKTILNKHHTI